MEAVSEGHDVCAKGRAWVNGPRFRAGVAAPFHPKINGMRAVATEVFRQVTGEEPEVTEYAEPDPDAWCSTRADRPPGVRHPHGWSGATRGRASLGGHPLTKEHDMSDDAKAAKELVETLKDGERGFAEAAEKVRDSEHPEWAETLQRLSAQRAGFAREIVDMGHALRRRRRRERVGRRGRAPRLALAQGRPDR